MEINLMYSLGYLSGFLWAWKMEILLTITTLFIWFRFVKWKNLSTTQKILLPIGLILSLYIIFMWLYVIINWEFEILPRFEFLSIVFYFIELGIVFTTIGSLVEVIKKSRER